MAYTTVLPNRGGRPRKERAPGPGRRARTGLELRVVSRRQGRRRLVVVVIHSDLQAGDLQGWFHAGDYVGVRRGYLADRNLVSLMPGVDRRLGCKVRRENDRPADRGELRVFLPADVTPVLPDAGLRKELRWTVGEVDLGGGIKRRVVVIALPRELRGEEV